MIDILAYLAGTFLMVSYFPQLYKTIKYRSVKDLSVLMLLSTFLSGTLYGLYAIFLDLLPVIIMNGIFTITVFVQLILKLRYSSK